jgi:hypothetical protein
VPGVHAVDVESSIIFFVILAIKSEKVGRTHDRLVPPKAERDITLSTFVPHDIRDRLTDQISVQTGVTCPRLGSYVIQNFGKSVRAEMLRQNSNIFYCSMGVIRYLMKLVRWLLICVSARLHVDSAQGWVVHRAEETTADQATDTQI